MDFPTDDGTPRDWSLQDWVNAAQELFSDHPNFGETAQDRYRDDGFELHPDNVGWLNVVAGLVPAAARTLDFFMRDGQVVPKGFVTMAALEVLSKTLSNVDLSHLHVTMADYGAGQCQPQPLPSHVAAQAELDQVDLRDYCSPVEDQKQTMRCSAFAWTHAVALAHTASGHPAPPLSPSFTMLEFQRMQGDFRDYRTAWKGGDGTEAGPRPGECIMRQGTCRQDLWPNDSPDPQADERAMAEDASQYALDALIQPIGIDDVKKVLSMGCPVHVAMTTGPKFADLGRDGVLDAAEKPSGEHGWHAMLIVGYVDQYYIVKNSWGPDWGDQGYCYVPRKVLVDAQAEFTAMLPQAEEQACPQCQTPIPEGARFCMQCGHSLQG